MFQNNCCSHSFCLDCISKYVAAKIRENLVDVKCPGSKCAGVLQPCSCQSIRQCSLRRLRIGKGVLSAVSMLRKRAAICTFPAGIDRFSVNVVNL
ncbi:hypothetical protein RJ641_019746 [Dillenia turbinata]|uniref:Zinc finger C3HC4 RING-type domain-containing protein n=1 Tax=Dillenia turbinata TaxID=194707 RepID=A0AAN8UKU9_9MAGN